MRVDETAPVETAPAPVETAPAPVNGTAQTEAPDTPPPDTAPTASDKAGDRVIAPVPLNTPVQPIAGTTKRVEIVLEIVIDTNGHVTSARAINGFDPYATAAIEATQAWSFRPATKAGIARASRISFLVTYEPAETAADQGVTKAQEGAPAPGERTSSTAEGDTSPAAAATASASATPMTEVIVLGEIPDPGARGFTRAEVRNLAGAFDDPLRSIEVLPGVSPILTGLPLFFVRGAPSGNVGYFVDGIRVPLLYHAFLGPSVLNPAFIEKVDLHAGPMPARFGRYAGAAVETQLAAPRGHLRGELNARLLDTGGFIEAPTKDGRGYAMLGGRYSYTALLLSLVAPEQRVDYWDYQALVGYRVGRNDEVSLFTLGAYDYMGTNGSVDGGTEFHRVDLRYAHDFSSNARGRIATTYGYDRTRSETGVLQDNQFASRLNFDLNDEDIVVRVGADISIDDYGMVIDPAIQEPEIYEDLFPPRTDSSGGAFLEFVFFPRKRVQVIPGVRADIYSSLGTTVFSVDPRLAVQYQLTKNVTASHAIGVAHQTPNFIPNIPGVSVGGLDVGLQRSLQAETSYEFRLPWEITASVGGYINGTENLSDPIGLTQTLSIDETSGEEQALGKSAGIEIYLKRPMSRRLNGILSYTFSRTTRSYDRISTVYAYDRPHLLNLAASYDLGHHWQASAKIALASGIPGRVTTLDGFVYNEDSRSRPLTRLDVKLAKTWYVSDHFRWQVFAEVLNSTFAPSVARRECTVNGCEDEGTAPIVLPNLGAELVWD